MATKPRPPVFTKNHLLQIKSASKANRADSKEIFEAFKKLTKERRDELFGTCHWWSWVYELTVIQHHALWFAILGLADDLKHVMDSPGDKTQAFIDFASNYSPDDAAVKKVFGPDADDERKCLATSLFVALLKQIECLENKGSYMSDLVAKVGADSDDADAAFFNALQIDRTVVSCPTFGARISRAVLDGDEEFFKSLSSNLKKKRRNNSPKKMEIHNDLRIMLQATHESGLLHGMSMTEADKTFIQELSVYPNDGEDPARSLHKFILRWKNNK